MVMKDKLVKNHHKGMYYRMRKATIFILASFTLVVAIVVPTYIHSRTNRNPATGFAAENNTSDSQTEVVENEKSENSEYEKYSDQ